jgi:hypothetical protein
MDSGRSNQRRLALWVLAGLVVAAPIAAAKNKPHRDDSVPPQDSIEVVGHILPTSLPVAGFVCTRHFSSYYLYAEHESGHDLTLIDVSKASRPVVLADVPYGEQGGSAALVAVAGTAALISS